MTDSKFKIDFSTVIETMHTTKAERDSARATAREADRAFIKARNAWFNHEQDVPELSVPRSIAIVAMGRSLDGYVKSALSSGGRMTGIDEVWAINAAGGCIASDRIFMMDPAGALLDGGGDALKAAQECAIEAVAANDADAVARAYVALGEAQAAHRPDLENYAKWLPNYKGVLYSSEPDERVPSCRRFPIEEVVAEFGVCYFVTTIAYALAYATYIGVERICMFGCDFAYSDTQVAETGHNNAAYWIGVARGRGVQVDISTESTLLAMHRMKPAITHYGFDTAEARRRGGGCVAPSQM